MCPAAPNSQENRATYAVRPLAGFIADLDRDRYDFENGMAVVRPPLNVLDRMKEWMILPDGYWTINKCTEWLLVTKLSEEGVVPALRKVLEPDLVELFLLALNLVKPTEAVAPCKFKAYGSQEAPDWNTIRDWDDYVECDYTLVEAHWPGIFEGKDLARVKDLWPRVTRAMGRPLLEFFTELEDIQEELPNGSVVTHYPRTLLDRLRDIRQFSPLWRTRLARALGLFGIGRSLPLLPAFLMMCVVLETLFSLEESKEYQKTHSLTRELAERAAAVLTKPGPYQVSLSAGECEKLMSGVYSTRRSVVHGFQLIDQMDEKVQQDAFWLARMSLQNALVDDDLFERLTAVETDDRMGAAQMRLRTFYKLLLDGPGSDSRFSR